MKTNSSNLELVQNECVRFNHPDFVTIVHDSGYIQTRPILYCYAAERPEYFYQGALGEQKLIPALHSYVLDDGTHFNSFPTPKEVGDRIGQLYRGGEETKRTTGAISGLNFYWLLYEVHPFKINEKERNKKLEEYCKKIGFMSEPMLTEELKFAVGGPDLRYRKLTPHERIIVEKVAGLRKVEPVK